MEFNLLTISLMMSAFVLILVGSFLLIRFNWFKGWLIGSIGLGALSIALLFSVIILSFNAYVGTSKTDVIASVSFKELSPKHYQVELTESQGELHRFELKGDLWEINATVLNWGTFFESQGLKPYYRVDQVRSSYRNLIDAEKLASSSVTIEAGLADNLLNLLTSSKSDSLLFLQSRKTKTGALPMADGALFSIRLNKAGLISKPENQQAFSSIR